MALKALLKTFLLQMSIAGLFFVAMLLDPLAGVWVALFYFLVVGSFFIYKYFNQK